MTPFQEFRMWARRAPSGERAMAGTAAVIVLVLLVWLLVPAGDDELAVDASEQATSGSEFDEGSGATDGTGGESDTTSGDVTAADGASSSGSSSGGGDGGAGASSNGGGTSTVGDNSTTSGGGGGAGGEGTSAAGGGCSSPPGSAPGIGGSEIRIAVVTVEVIGPAANELFGIASPEEQEADVRAVVDATNKAGGVACRRLVPEFHRANPADRSQLQRLCLDIVESGVYAVIDIGGYAAFPQKQCFGQNKVPYFGGYFLNAKEQRDFYPYLFNAAVMDTLHTNTFLGMGQRGFFQPDRGFEKLGFVYQDCNPEMIANARKAVAAAGVPNDKFHPFNLGCPSAFASPADLAQAVFEFRRSGVTHVTVVNAIGDIANFTNTAERQGYRPQYLFPDEALISISYGSQPPNYDNIDGAIAVTQMRQGEETTPGSRPSPGTQRCNQIYAAADRPPVYERPAATGRVCNQVWMFQAALENAPALDREALAAGLRRAGSIEMSFPDGPVDWTGERTTTGGQFWRTAVFRNAECECWRVPDVEFHASVS